MSGLKDRIHRLKSTASSQNVRITHPTSTNEHGFEGERIDEWAAFDGRMEHNDWGAFIRRERRYPLHHRHGIYSFGQLVGEAGPLSVLSASPQEVEHHRMLFIDTETTGLGIGTGNVPFMIGFGYYLSDALVVEQCFIRNPSEELAMLVYLQEKLHEFTHLVTYNGKTFDWPIVKNRYVLNRLKLEDRHLEHIDLLYPSRSLWKHTLSTCRLGTVEQERLGIARHEDVPGSMAPALYFQYLACKDVEVIRGVFEHNEVDILTLAGLSIHFTEVLAGKAEDDEMEAEEAYRLGVWLDKAGRTSLACQVFERLVQRPVQGNPEYLLALASWYKKARNYTCAVPLWERYIKANQDRRIASLESYLELAKYYEHRCKNMEHALYYAGEAKQQALFRMTLNRGDLKQREALQQIDKRISRLQKKQKAQ
jgi:uncharacterized protein YprB with RNaseH-like and TPR domain